MSSIWGPTDAWSDGQIVVRELLGLAYGYRPLIRGLQLRDRRTRISQTSA